MQTPTYAQALFPLPMFPPMSYGTYAAPTPREPREKKPEDRDELVEVGAIVALLKLAFG